MFHQDHEGKNEMSNSSNNENVGTTETVNKLDPAQSEIDSLVCVYNAGNYLAGGVILDRRIED